MIPHREFGRLRLSEFLPHADSTELENWEYLERVWVGEALGFSEWLRLESDPKVLRVLALDLSQFPQKAATAVLDRIGLPVREGMTGAQLRKLFGAHVREHKFVADRVTREYLTPKPNRYRVSCTVHKTDGLIHVVVMVPPIGDEV